MSQNKLSQKVEKLGSTEIKGTVYNWLKYQQKNVNLR